MDASFAHRSWSQKLGLKPGMRLLTVNAPENYAHLLPNIPKDVTISTAMQGEYSCIHLFVSDEAALVPALFSTNLVEKPRHQRRGRIRGAKP